MIIDLWYKGEHIAYANATFYPNEGIYRGNLFNENGKIIGDYSEADSTQIEKRFPGMFDYKSKALSALERYFDGMTEPPSKAEVEAVIVSIANRFTSTRKDFDDLVEALNNSMIRR